MRAMKALAALALALGACTFDESGTRYEGAADASVDAEAAPAIDAPPPPPPPVDAPSIAVDAAGSWCDFDGQCETLEDASWCLDCAGFVCDLDGTCENGEDPLCLDCL